MAILDPEFVLPSLKVKDKEEAIRTLSLILFQHGRLSDLDLFIENVMDREKDFSTGFGDGLAIPHGKTHGVLKPSVVVAKIPDGVEWASMDNNPVRLIFLLAVPEEAAGTTHLKLIATLAENLMNEDVRERLEALNQREELYDYVNSILEGELR